MADGARTATGVIIGHDDHNSGPEGFDQALKFRPIVFFDSGIAKGKPREAGFSLSSVVQPGLLLSQVVRTSVDDRGSNAVPSGAGHPMLV